MPLNEVCTVKGIRVNGEVREYAECGENIDLGLVGLELQQIT